MLSLGNAELGHQGAASLGEEGSLSLTVWADWGRNNKTRANHKLHPKSDKQMTIVERVTEGTLLSPNT